MYSNLQTTILNEANFFGQPKDIKNVFNVKFLPNLENSGIIFKRTDLKKDNILELNYNNIFVENNQLILKNNANVCLYDIELLITSIWASKIDNLLIEIDGDRLPYLDGTSDSLLFLLKIAGRRELEGAKNTFDLAQDVSFKKDNFQISISPNKNYIIEIKNKKNSFLFDTQYLPYQDSLSKIRFSSNNLLEYYVICILGIIMISGNNTNFYLVIENFNLEETLKFFKNLFKNHK